MASFLVQASYTSEAVASLIATPQDRMEVVKKAVKKLGGKLTGGWLAFGDYDVVFTMDMPDNVSAAALALSAAAGGSVKSIKTTPLLTMTEAMAAFKKAGNTGYKPVGAE